MFIQVLVLLLVCAKQKQRINGSRNTTYFQKLTSLGDLESDTTSPSLGSQNSNVIVLL